MTELTRKVEAFMTLMEGSTSNLSGRLDALERQGALDDGVSLTTFGCNASDPSVVTGVSLRPGIGYDPILSVQRATVCAE